ncbi:MAG: endonuclease/exonuclease/phosphatase family protein [Flavobacterium sp.]|uniref:endonuclease/exonuclease/phosphatase family protein n=1 Tax=Flavobacterium sp. TaxID=239 RepID=UPI00260E60FD|nr:endonuclease/exonuclease/phosphatase family protein [Flavobacterium sp.]MDD5150479.1 endonuclease/exonuclease/phosphatase family protein [Flavobacterium sp.]
MKQILTLMTALTLFFGNAQNLKVMTYNIRLDVAVDGENDWTHRKDFFTSQIQFYEPDVFGVQEATPNQVNDIAAALTQYGKIGIGRDGIGKGESSSIYYKMDRFKVLESNTFWLSETPDVISIGWDAAFNRVCTYGLFKDLKTKKMFWVFNTHLDHIGELARTNGIQLILSKIEALNIKKYPVIFMGDFNSKPNEDRIITLKKVMNDAREISKEKPFGPSGTFNGFKHNEPVTMLIDYIFISKNSSFNVNKYAVLSDSKDLKYPSDHLPVYVEIAYK